MLPPSRGKLNAGAFAPSAKGKEGADRGAGDPPALSTGSTGGLLTGGFPTAGFAAAAFEAVAVGGADFPGLDDFNLFDGALCDAFAVALPVCLFFVFVLDLVALVPRVFKGAFFADVADWARIALPVEGLEDFLRVFLDIRLPFVAFRGSIIEVLRQVGIEQIVGRF